MQLPNSPKSKFSPHMLEYYISLTNVYDEKYPPCPPANMDDSSVKVFENVHLVCWDFDHTITSKHSGGYLEFNNDDDLVQQVRKLSESITDEWVRQYHYLKTQAVFQVIVTFSDKLHNQWDDSFITGQIAGEDMIRAALLTRIPVADALSIPIYDKFPSERNKKYGADEKYPNYPMPLHKEWHLTQAMKEHYILDRSTVLLVDDTLGNIRNARKRGHQAMSVLYSENTSSYGFQTFFKVINNQSF